MLAIIALVAALVAGELIAHLTAATSYSAAQNRDIGSNVSVSGSQVPSAIKAVGANASQTPFAETQPLGPIDEITPTGKLPAPMTLRFKLSKQLKADDVAFLATSEEPGGPWTLLQPTISSDGWYASVQTDHLSWWQPLWYDLKAAASDFKKEIVDAVSGDMTTEAEKPHCDNEPQARQDNYAIASSAKETLYWCFGIEGGARVLKVVNRMRYPLEVSHLGFTVNQQAGWTLDLDQVARLTSGQTTILYPFEEVDYTVSLPLSSRALIATQFSGYAQSLYRLEVGVTTLVNILDLFGAGTLHAAAKYSKDWFVKSADVVNSFLGIKNCANVLVHVFHGDARAGDVISGCFTPANIMKALGWKGLLLAPLMAVGSLVEYFHSELNSAVDQITGRDKYQILVSRFATGTVASYTISDSVPWGIAAGPDGNLWFTASRLTDAGPAGWIGRITPDGRMTEFSLPNSSSNRPPTSIISGPDGNLWFTIPGVTNLFAPGPGSAIPGQIGRITTAGKVTLFPPASAQSDPIFLATGPDGNVWFTDTDGSIGQITPTGHITEFPVKDKMPYGGIAAGADGNMWFAAIGAIGRITRGGQVTLFPADMCPNVSMCALAAGPDGNLWFTDGGNGFIGRVATNGHITKFPTSSVPLEIAAGPDGNLWFTAQVEIANGPNGFTAQGSDSTQWEAIGRITPDGTITFPISNSQGYEPVGIALGPDGLLWVVGSLAGQAPGSGGTIWRIAP